MRYLIACVLAMLLIGCSNEAQLLDEAISASRQGLSLSAEQDPERQQEGRARLEHAEAIYARLLEADQTNQVYLNNYGWVLMHLGRHDEAAAYLERAGCDENCRRQSWNATAVSINHAHLERSNAAQADLADQ